LDWTEKHRPRSLKEVVGNGPTVARLRAWAEAWATGIPDKRAIVLAGSPGTGKTSTALALANDMGWSVIELNASDARNAGTIQRIATAGAVHQTFGSDGSFSTGGRKLIVLDEADNLYERAGSDSGEDGSSFSDRGGKSAIIETIRQTRQPIILIVNDLYALEKGSGSALRGLTEVLKFAKVNVRSIPTALARIATLEGLQVDREVLEHIAVRAEGDLRAAVRDLESISLGRTRVTMLEAQSLGRRDTETSLFDLMRHVLKGRAVADVKSEIYSVDATPEDLVLWVDENLPKEYRDPRDLVAGYEMLARADVFLGRTKSTQDYGLWAYAGELSTLGVMTARRHEYKEFVPFGFPQWLSKMSRTKGSRQIKDQLAEHLGRHTHTSRRKARMEMVETVAQLFRLDHAFAVQTTMELEMSDDEVAVLLGPDATGAAIKRIRADVEARLNPPKPDDEAAKPKPRAKPRPAEDGEAPAEEKPARPKPGVGQKGLFGF
jgi:replication factor C large subunit